VIANRVRYEPCFELQEVINKNTQQCSVKLYIYFCMGKEFDLFREGKSKFIIFESSLLMKIFKFKMSQLVVERKTLRNVTLIIRTVQ
jgi:hypothetical protein